MSHTFCGSSMVGDHRLQYSFRGATRELPLGGVHSSPVAESYRDAPAADLEFVLAEIRRGRSWREVVASRFAETNPWLYRIVTDSRRDLFFRTCLPISEGRVLDIGSGWGQIALPLARRCRVCALEPTPERLQFIELAARQEGVAKNMWFVQADFLDTSFSGTFDLITCIGVLEWVPRFAPHSDPRDAQLEFLKRARAGLARGGRLVIGIENRVGLKYLLGAPDDHLGVAGVAVYDAALADQKWRALSGQPMRSLTYTRAEYTDLLTAAGFSDVRFWSAFPDYKVPDAIIPAGRDTDTFLAANFVPEHDGIRGDRLPNQDELASHYRSLAHLGISSDFAPSFYICAQA